MSDKSEKMSDKKVVKVDADLLQKLKVYCAKHDLRMGEMVELLIKHLLQTHYQQLLLQTIILLSQELILILLSVLTQSFM